MASLEADYTPVEPQTLSLEEELEIRLDPRVVPVRRPMRTKRLAWLAVGGIATTLLAVAVVCGAVGDGRQTALRLHGPPLEMKNVVHKDGDAAEEEDDDNEAEDKAEDGAADKDDDEVDDEGEEEEGSDEGDNDGGDDDHDAATKTTTGKPTTTRPTTTSKPTTTTTTLNGLEAVLNKLPTGNQPKLWCHGDEPPKIWEPSLEGKVMQVKILSYNLFWWNLYGKRGGNGNSAGNLITGSMQDGKYDVMGFQECNNPWQVLSPVGLMNEYAALKGNYQTCAAYRKSVWQLLGHGVADVAEDLPHNFYGRRGALWLRLKHKSSHQTLFFVNHHGPLSINSGGLCGGQATAHNLIKVIQKHGKKGDTVVIVGDFNANAASLTIKTLRRHFLHAYNGLVFGGIDNIFSNLNISSVVKNTQLGTGGSDHHALSTVLKLERSTPKGKYQAIWDRPFKALSDNGFDNKHFFCGLMENNVDYTTPGNAWKRWGITKPDKCCKLCQENKKCKAWTFYEGGQCVFRGGKPTKRTWHWGAVSGLPYR